MVYDLITAALYLQVLGLRMLSETLSEGKAPRDISDTGHVGVGALQLDTGH